MATAGEDFGEYRQWLATAVRAGTLGQPGR